MPAMSKSQQHLFGMVRAYQKGELKHPSTQVKRMAKSIDPGDVKDFAATSTKDLPQRVKKSSQDMLKVAFMKLAIETSIDPRFQPHQRPAGFGQWAPQQSQFTSPAVRPHYAMGNVGPAQALAPSMPSIALNSGPAPAGYVPDPRYGVRYGGSADGFRSVGVARGTRRPFMAPTHQSTYMGPNLSAQIPSNMVPASAAPGLLQRTGRSLVPQTAGKLGPRVPVAPALNGTLGAAERGAAGKFVGKIAPVAGKAAVGTGAKILGHAVPFLGAAMSVPTILGHLRRGNWASAGMETLGAGASFIPYAGLPLWLGASAIGDRLATKKLPGEYLQQAYGAS